MNAPILALLSVWFLGLAAGGHAFTGGAIHLLVVAALVVHLLTMEKMAQV